MDISLLYQKYLLYPSIQTDTRKLQAGDIFFALKGPSFNGNAFAAKALELGAAYVVIDEQQDIDSEQLILVDDVLDTLHQLAKYHRETFKIPFIGITGSNGKTTTKELVHAVLATEHKTYYTQGNLNNHIGVPLTILSIKPDAEIAIIEMGANHQKEIASYCIYAEPNIGVITNCGKAHLEGFGGIEGVRKGKGELYDYIRAHDGSILAFDDYDYFHTMSHDINDITWYGTQNGAVTGEVLSSDPFLTVEINKGFATQKKINTQLVGDYNLPNVLCAVAIGLKLNVSEENIIKGIESYQPSNSRSQLVKKGSNEFILDAYNANPSSMKAAIKNFAALNGTDKWLLLGAMMELGEESVKEHQELIHYIQQFDWAQVILVGGDFAKVERGDFQYFKDVSEASEWLKTEKIENAMLLVKGSNSTHMVRIVDVF